MNATIIAFEASPDKGQGMARHIRVRWALEEVGRSYDVRLVSFADLKEADYPVIHPFGQIPTYEESGLALFESRAIVLHIASHSPGLLPDHASARTRDIMWVIAALNTVEPPNSELDKAEIFEKDKPWYEEHAAMIKAYVRVTICALSNWMDDSEWLGRDLSVQI